VQRAEQPAVAGLALAKARLRRLVRAARLPFVGKGGILLYHRIATLDHDPWGLAVTGAHFDAHLELLRRRTSCLPLTDLLARRAAGTLPGNATAVTFDDGYADNLYAALPLLERHEIPATVFILSGFVGGDEETWWDRLEQAIFGAPELPAEIELQAAGQRVSWTRPAGPPCEASRADLHVRLYDCLAHADTGDRERAIESLWQQLDRRPVLRASYRPLDETELRRLADHPLITIGAHTRTHPHLARISPARQQDELCGSKADLEARLGRPIRVVAYPHGSNNAATASAARFAGFQAGFTTEPRVVPHRLDPFRIPRINVEDQDADQFATSLSWYRLLK